MIDYSDYPPELAYLMREVLREIDKLMTDLELGRILVTAWERLMRELLTRFHIAAYMIGAAIRELLETDWGIIRDYVSLQLGFLDNFAQIIANTAEFSIAWKSRAEMYGNAISGSYWKGRSRGIPILPAYPGDGQSECKTRCQCQLDIIEVDPNTDSWEVFWRLGMADHCPTCIERSETWKPLEIRNGVIVTPMVKEFRGKLESLLYASQNQD